MGVRQRSCYHGLLPSKSLWPLRDWPIKCFHSPALSQDWSTDRLWLGQDDVGHELGVQIGYLRSAFVWNRLDLLIAIDILTV